MIEPTRDRPTIPDGYGVPDGLDDLLPWSSVERRLVEATHYWLATTRPDGRPHVVPRWGVWIDGRFWYDGSPDTVHVRNLTRDPACVLHLEDGLQAVIVEGRSVESSPPDADLGSRLSTVMTAKYGPLGYAPSPEAWDGAGAGGLRVLTPERALAWFEFPNDVTRFRFAR